MSSPPKFYLLYIDGVSSEPIKFWSIGEVGPYTSQHAEQALSSCRLELTTDSGDQVLDKKHLRRSAYFAKYGKWQLSLFVVFALVTVLGTSNAWLRVLGGVCLLFVFAFQVAPSWPSFFTKLFRRSQGTGEP